MGSEPGGWTTIRSGPVGLGFSIFKKVTRKKIRCPFKCFPVFVFMLICAFTFACFLYELLFYELFFKNSFWGTFCSKENAIFRTGD